MKIRWELEAIVAHTAKEAFGILEKMKRIAPATLAPPEAMPEAGRRDKLASTMTIRLVALAEYVDDSCQRKEKNDKHSQSSWIPKLVGWLKLFVSRPAFAESPAGREEFVLCLKFLK